MIVSLTQALHLYMVCKNMTEKYGLSVHIKNKGRFKSQLYMQNTIFSKSQTLKYFFFARFGDITKKDGISTYNLR